MWPEGLDDPSTQKMWSAPDAWQIPSLGPRRAHPANGVGQTETFRPAADESVSITVETYGL